jgi:hypothetical protein
MTKDYLWSSLKWSNYPRRYRCDTTATILSPKMHREMASRTNLLVVMLDNKADFQLRSGEPTTN